MQILQQRLRQQLAAAWDAVLRRADILGVTCVDRRFLGVLLDFQRHSLALAACFTLPYGAGFP